MLPGTRGVSPAEASAQTEGRLGVRVRLQLKQRARHLVLFNLAIDSKLRGCDLVAVTSGRCLRRRSSARPHHRIQKKTGPPVQFEITEQTRASIRGWPRLAPRRRSGLN